MESVCDPYFNLQNIIKRQFQIRFVMIYTFWNVCIMKVLREREWDSEGFFVAFYLLFLRFFASLFVEKERCCSFQLWRRTIDTAADECDSPRPMHKKQARRGGNDVDMGCWRCGNWWDGLFRFAILATLISGPVVESGVWALGCQEFKGSRVCNWVEWWRISCHWSGDGVKELGCGEICLGFFEWCDWERAAAAGLLVRVEIFLMVAQPWRTGVKDMESGCKTYYRLNFSYHAWAASVRRSTRIQHVGPLRCFWDIELLVEAGGRVLVGSVEAADAPWGLDRLENPMRRLNSGRWWRRSSRSLILGLQLPLDIVMDLLPSASPRKPENSVPSGQCSCRKLCKARL